jgi:hypothetical protein
MKYMAQNVFVISSVGNSNVHLDSVVDIYLCDCVVPSKGLLHSVGNLFSCITI